MPNSGRHDLAGLRAPLAVVAALAVVVVAGVASSGALWRHAGRSPLVDVHPARLIGFTLLGAVVVVTAYLVARTRASSWREGWRSLLLFVALVAGLVYLLSIVPAHYARAPLRSQTSTVRNVPSPTAAPARRARPFDHVAPWWWVGGLLAAAVALVLWELRRRSTLAAAEEPVPEIAQAEEVIAAVDVSLEEIERERDPRRAVIKAYVRMEATLARSGLPRRSVETPLEYMLRALGSLRVPRPPVERLTSLFNEARFSTHRVDSSMKADAIAALQSIRGALGAGA